MCKGRLKPDSQISRSARVCFWVKTSISDENCEGVHAGTSSLENLSEKIRSLEGSERRLKNSTMEHLLAGVGWW
jgi:hypothetical protein